MRALDIGFVGLGVMGAPMATHLARAGHRLVLLDLEPAKADALAQALGGSARVARTPAEVAAAGEIVITHRAPLRARNGRIDHLARVRPLLDRMGRAVFHLGALGAGYAMKCINNCITAVTLANTELTPGMGEKQVP